ncbi:MAG: transporter [Armatimonadota bacterium]
MRPVLLALLLLVSATLAEATPFFTQDARTLPEGGWRIEEHVLYSNTDSSLSDGEKVPLVFGGEFTNFIARTRVRYGLRDDLTLFVDAPFVRRRWIQPGGAKVSESGLGDLFFHLKYKYHDNRPDRTRRAWQLSLKPHTGDYVGLPGPLAQGTGTTDWIALHLWEKERGNKTYYSSLGYVLTGSRSDTGRNPGDLILFNLAVERKLNPRTNFVWEIMGRYEGNASGGALPAPPSGATVVSISPGLQYTMTASDGRYTTLEAGFPIPLIRKGDLPAIQDYAVYAGGYTVF